MTGPMTQIYDGTGFHQRPLMVLYDHPIWSRDDLDIVLEADGRNWCWFVRSLAQGAALSADFGTQAWRIVYSLARQDERPGLYGRYCWAVYRVRLRQAVERVKSVYADAVVPAVAGVMICLLG